MSGIAASETRSVDAVAYVALTGGPGKAQISVSRQTLLAIDAAHEETLLGFLSLQHSRKSELQTQLCESLSTARRVHAGAHPAGLVLVGNDDLLQI